MNKMPADLAAAPTRRPSLTFRMTALVTGILVLLIAITLFLAWRYGHRAADEAYDKLLTGASLQIAERVGVTDGQIQVDLPYSAFELLALSRNDRVFYRIIGPSGQTLTGYDDLPAPAKVSAGAPVIYDARYSGEPVRIAAAVRQISEPGIAGTVQILVAQSILERQALARDIAFKAALLLATVAIVAVALALLAVRYALAPLTKVQRALLSRNPSDLSPFVIETPRELETVVNALNRFIFRLDRRIEAVQSFVADAAHQLRTPIAAIRAQAELAVGEDRPDRLRRINQRILDRSVAVSRLAEQLLSRAMITHRSDAAELQPLDLRRIAVEAEREAHRFAVTGEEPIFCDLCEHPLMVAGDAFSLREAVKNLINNAQTHGRPPIRIHVAQNGTKARIGVIDHGEGISAEIRRGIGARFAQAETRAEGGKSTGTGLGLSIAHDVASFHSGELVCSETGADEFEIALALPLASSRP